ncbi:DUF418 domain-containing protein [Actinomycetospora termitidis]|uniref:DUF418 domain-containing protein n=1 Tax=Actinomycetospora termitidis TaxID=3053470 RepID=A0ABT7MJ25_9PSEU|nr:DUF418 domain-containing protein [Actinomycetospora sp. Odt1-22]MDL5159987.1 DUF418 domain-containing protein [Actinomycetospora sp. Odt1-22]
MTTEPTVPRRRPAHEESGAAVSTPGDRIESLDVLRGVALCGILVINVYQQLVWLRGDPTSRNVLPTAVDLIFFERFMPIFAMLFGVGFGLFLERAGRRTDRPRLVLARRLAILLVIGGIHQFFHVGEALLPYALVGLVLLIPMSFLSPRACLVVGIVLLVLLPQVQTSVGLIAGLLPFGFGLARVGVPDGLRRHPGRIAVAFVVSAVVVLAWTVAQLAGVRLPVVSVFGAALGGDLLHATASVAGAIAYSCLVLLLLRTPVAPALDAVFAPLGRMALTNYLSATVLFLVSGPLLGIDSLADGPQIAALTVGILVVQIVWSRLWLRHFAYGPVEWGWRCLTWGQRAPLRRVG